MEILNHNQRKSAWWRLFGMILLLLLLVGGSVFAMRNQFEGHGKARLEKDLNDCQNEIRRLKGENADLKKELNKVNGKLKACEEKPEDVDERIEILNIQIVGLERNLGIKTTELQDCKTELTACKGDLSNERNRPKN